MSTVEKVELGNGAILGEVLQAAGYKLTKDEARTVFEGTADRIFCHCAVPTCEIENCGERFEVGRIGSSSIFIGCVSFNASEVEAVKKWLEGGE